MKTFIAMIRPAHWVKNIIVLAPFFFALGDPDQAAALSPAAVAFLKAFGAAALFCALSSGVYVMNDIRDRDLDRKHPSKSLRPIASGAISMQSAALVSAALVAASVAAALALSRPLAAVMAAYFGVQVAYSFALKRTALLDVFLIASGFVLRALGGALVISVAVSPWLVLCTFLLALFFGFCKRRQEKAVHSMGEGENRPSLPGYDERVLDQSIAVSAAATIVAYSMYTLSPETIGKFGSPRLGFSIPFVIFGVCRYLDLVYRHKQGGKPEKTIFADPPLLLNGLLYGAVVLFVVCTR